MTVNYPFLLLAVALLWFPRHWLRWGFASKRRRQEGVTRSREEPWKTREAGDPRISAIGEFSKFRNYADLLRAGAGSLILAGGFGLEPCLGVAADAPRSMVYAVLAVRAAILLIGLLIQTVRYEKQKLRFYPAIFFIAGLSVGLCDYRAAAFAFVLVWTVNSMFGGAQSFLSCYAFLLVLFGYCFSRQGNLSVILAGLLCFLPVLLSLLANRPLVILGRKSASGAK